MEIKLVYAAENNLCEGPLWRAETQELWWVDIDNGHIQKWSERGGPTSVLKRDYSVGTFAFTRTDDLLLATHKGIEWWDAATDHVTTIHSLAATPHLRFNDGKPDPLGRFWAGTMPMTKPEFQLGLGALYRLDADFKLHKMDTGFGLSNGMDWTGAQDRMIFADTTSRKIYAYDYDARSGGVSDRQTLISFDDELGVPDGLTLDEEDFVWVASPRNGRILRFAPDGTLDRIVDVGTRGVTSLTFGGEDMKTLFITTARHNLPATELTPMAGAILSCRPGVAGRSPGIFAGQYQMPS